MSRSRLGVGLALFALGLAYGGYQAERFPFGLRDEGYLYYIAQARLDGLLPYRDLVLHNYLPGLFYTFAAVFAVFGKSVVAARAVQIIGLSLTPVVLWRALRDRVPAPLAVAVGVAMALTPGPMHKFYVGLLNAVLLAALLAAWERPDRRRMALLGAATGLGLTFRVDVGWLGVLGTGGWFVLRHGWVRAPLSELPRSLASWLGGLVAAMAPMALVLAGEGILGDYLAQITGFGQGIAPRVGAWTANRPPPIEMGLDVEGARRALLFWSSFWPVASLAVATLSLARRVPRETTGAAVLVLGWTLGNLPQYALERTGIQHLTQHHGAVLVAAAWTAALLWRRGPREHRLALAAAAFAVLYPVPLLIGDSAGSYGKSSDRVTWHALSNGVVYPRPKADIDRVVEHLITHTEPGESIGVMPFGPGFAWLSGRPLAGPHVHLVEEVWTPEREAEVAKACGDVRYFVYSAQQGDGTEWVDGTTTFMPTLVGCLADLYEPVLEAKSYTLYERRGANPPAERGRHRRR